MRFTNLLHHLNHRSTRLTPKFNNIPKFIFILFAIVFATQLVKTIFAEDNIIKYTQEAQKSGNNAESWQQNAWNTTTINALTSLTGEIPDSVLNGETNPDGSPQTYTPGGAIGTFGYLASSLYNRPASGIEYIAQVKNEFLGKPVYAQGIGFKGLQPILPLWRIFRNTVYILTSVVFVVLGIMIMLRVKMNPQTIVTIQVAIPRIVTTLILVTFSYAIAGLLIDLSYLVQTLVLALLFQSQPEGITGKLVGQGFKDLSTASFVDFFQLSWRALPITVLFLFSVIPGVLIGALVGLFGKGISITSALTVLKGGPMGIMTAVGGKALIGGVIALLIILIIILCYLIKFYIGMIKCYITIIFRIILGPFEIGLGAFPNSKMGFSSWFYHLIANLAVFPISIIFLVMANMIIDYTSGKSGLWTPGLLSGIGEGALTSLSGGLVPVGIGIATMMILSKLPELIPQVIFQLKPSGFTMAVGEGLKSVPIVSGASKSISRSASEEFGDRFIKPVKSKGMSDVRQAIQRGKDYYRNKKGLNPPSGK